MRLYFINTLDKKKYKTHARLCYGNIMMGKLENDMWTISNAILPKLNY